MRARFRTHLETIVVAGVVGVLVAGGPAVAGPLVDFAKRSGDADRVDGLNASRTPRAGQLLALNANKRFPTSVVPAGAAGATGPAGPAGANGATGGPGAKGDTGPAGAKGDTGAAGHDGIDGLHGTDGTNGVDGAPGAKGDTGGTGANGADGAPGAKGDTGATGAPGAKGDKGDTGAAGSDGTDGATGPKGDKGEKGATGAAGADGATGPKGDKGDIGAQGAKGDTGSTGAAGANGSNGAPGEKGDKGDTGALGAKGDKGDQGEAAAYAPIVDINPILRPSRSNLWDRVQMNGNSWFYGYRSSYSDGTSASYLEWDIPLQEGKWTIDVVYVKAHDAGILSLSLDGDDVGPEVDAYQAEEDGIGFNQVETFSHVGVAETGIHKLRIRTASKNPASADYFGYLTWIRLVRE